MRLYQYSFHLQDMFALFPMAHHGTVIRSPLHTSGPRKPPRRTDPQKRRTNENARDVAASAPRISGTATSPGLDLLARGEVGWSGSGWGSEGGWLQRERMERVVGKVRKTSTKQEDLLYKCYTVLQVARKSGQNCMHQAICR